jgi:hypothetical protein
MVRLAEREDLDDVTHLIAEFRDWWGKSEPSSDVIREIAAQPPALDRGLRVRCKR